VRPEKMRLSPPAGSGGDNRIEATLREVVYAGAVSTFILAASDGSEIKVLAQNVAPTVLSSGGRVDVSWSAQHTVVLQA
jgi:spermidine/putrescine transport system ATP-binding protein